MSAPTEQRVTPLELFFDLVFVFAITRVTALMAHDLSWTTIGQGLLVLAALWWGWAAYAWLTNHVAGDEGRARVVVFVALGAMVLVALAVPDAFGDHALLFALAYLVMRLAHLGLYWVASSEDPEVHIAVARLLPTGIGGPLLLVAAAFADGTLQAALWLLALAIGVGAGAEDLGTRVALAAVLALGVEQVVGHVDEALSLEASTALFGGVALYLLAHVAFRWRNLHSVDRALVTALISAACIPLGAELNAVASLALVTVLVAGLILYETLRFGADRARVRMGT
jgi:low temperature requirement protein LtrA